MVLEIWSVFAMCGLIAVSLRQWRFGKQLILMQSLPNPQRRQWPRVSLIVPARDEGDTIEPAIRSLLAMDYPNLEIIAVNDRSADQTGAILHKIAVAEPRVTVVDVVELPSRWLGKVHALDQGVRHASGEWLLFSDADVHYQSQSLKKVVEYCDHEGLDYISVLPAIHAKTIWLRAFVSQVVKTAAIGLDLKALRDPMRTACVGGGAFNMVRRQIFQRTPGLEWLRLEVIDDAGLGYMLKKAGARMDVLGGLGEIEIEWYPSVQALVRGLEKNGFALLHYSMGLGAFYFLANWLFFLGAWYAPFASGSLALSLAMAICISLYLGSTVSTLRRMMPFPLTFWPLLPIVQFVMPLIAIRSAVLFLWRGGVRWRETFYPKRDLVAHQRLRVFELLRKRTFTASDLAEREQWLKNASR